MKEMDCIEVTVEKRQYAAEGVHKGMNGWICYDKCADGYWLVNFPRYGDQPDIATVSIHEADMKVVPVLNAHINEKLATQHEKK